MTDPLKPSVTLLMKLGSIIVHAEEGLSSKGHQFDVLALQSLLRDADVKVWLKAMDKIALIPKKR